MMYLYDMTLTMTAVCAALFLGHNWFASSDDKENKVRERYAKILVKAPDAFCRA